MDKKRGLIVLLLGIFIIISSINFIMMINLGSLDVAKMITGSGLVGTVSLFVEGGVGRINILVPENKTYSFDSPGTYLVELNVSADFEADEWEYSLYDVRHGVANVSNVTFTPNTTFAAVRWQNNITVYAKVTDYPWSSNSTVFFVDVPVSAPILAAIDDEMYVCEGEQFGYNFNATDVDEDALSFDISPRNPFYAVQTTTSGYTTKLARLYSKRITKANAGGIDAGSNSAIYIISVNDNYNSTSYVDTKDVNITVIEINNDPTFSNIGARTVYLIGENSTFLETALVSDVEDGAQTDGNLTFNLTYSNGSSFDLFEINSTNGTMVYTPTSGDTGVYNLEVCVNDTGIANPHTGISANCSQDGSASSVCDSFSLTVTNANRAPTIDDYSPTDLELSVTGTSTTAFSVTASDSDGTIPDVEWYVDGVLKETDEGNSTTAYSYSFGCGVSGAHTVTVNATDGLADATLQWNMSVSEVVCAVDEGRGGGGGAVLGGSLFAGRSGGVIIGRFVRIQRDH